MTPSLLPPTPAAIERAVEALCRGELVAFPTETVYGLGADAANPAAVSKIFAAKGRPATHPLIVHLPEMAALPEWSRAVPEVAWRLAEAFWPGPLTLILKRSSRVPDAVTGGQDTVGLRVPGHRVARALLGAFGGALAAPSANRFGGVSPTRAEHVAEELGEQVAVILDGGPCAVGIESTILDLSGLPERPARLLRPGGVSVADLARLLGTRPEVARGVGDAPRAPGTLPRHYAPRTPTALVAAAEPGSARVGVIARRAGPPGFEGVWKQLPDDAEGYARALYAALRELDGLGLEQLLIEAVPEDEAWLAVRDRVRRASTPADATTSTPADATTSTPADKATSTRKAAQP